MKRSPLPIRKSLPFVASAAVAMLSAAALPRPAAGAADAPPAETARGNPDNPAAAIEPFVNEQTFAVARADLTNLDPAAAARWLEQAMAGADVPREDREAFSKEARPAAEAAARWLTEFNKAGGKTAWMVFTFEDFPRSPMFLVVPLGPGADKEALRRLLAPGGTGPASVVESHGALLLASDISETEKIGRLRPQPRPDVAKALSAAGEGKLQVAVVPSADARKVLESMVPPLPGGKPGDVLTHGVVWATASVQPPPDVKAHVVVQSQDAASAEAFRDFLKSLPGLVRPGDKEPRNSPAARWGPLLAGADLAGAARVQGDRVVIDLGAKQAGAVAAHLRDAVGRQREQVMRVKTASNIKQLLLMCFVYANDHKDQFPDTLEQAIKGQDLPADLLIDPRHPQLKKGGFAYIKPPEGSKAGSDRMVIYEKQDPFGDGMNVGFADGHVEWVADENHFKKLLDEAQHAKAEVKRGAKADAKGESGK